MDPITAVGLIASIAQIAQQSTSLLIRLSQFYRDVKEAPARSKELRDELQTVTDLLNALKTTFDADSISLTDSLKRSTTEFQGILKQLETRLAAEKTEGLKKFKWPFTKADNERIISQIERYKATFTLALNINQTFPFLINITYSRRMLGDIGSNLRSYNDDRKLEVSEASPPAYTAIGKKIFDVPFDRNPYFSGRESLLDSLRRNLQETDKRRHNHRMALCGLGGVGKTQIALEYCYRYRSEYNYVFWISAVDQMLVLSGFRDIAKIVEVGVFEPKELVKELLKWFRETAGWLLVVDNLDEFSVIQGYLPSTDSLGHVLITTRNNDAEGIPAETLEVIPMDLDAAVELLISRAKLDVTSAVRSEAMRIVEELGGLPLAIEQAAAYVRDSKSIFKYLDVYRRNRRGLLSRKPKGNIVYEDTVATTWRLSFDRLKQISPTSITLIQLFAFLNPDEILIEFLVAGKAGLDTEIREVLDDELMWQDCLDALQMFSLIRVWGDGTKIGIHRLVQSVIKDQLDQDSWVRVSTQIIQLGLTGFPHRSDLETCRRYRAQLMTYLLDSGNDSKLARDHLLQRCILAERVASYLMEDGYYSDSSELRIPCHQILVRELGDSHPDTLDGLENLASSYRALGKFSDAMVLQQRSLELRQNVFGLQHPRTLTTVNNLAKLLLLMGSFHEAEKLNIETLKTRRQVLGDHHPDTLLSMNNLAECYYALGKFKDAADLHSETLKLRKLTLGSEHRDTLWSMSNLSAALEYTDAGMTQAEIMKLDQDLLNLREKILGPNHPDTLWSLSDVAAGYRNSGEFAKAAELDAEALRRRNKLLGGEHPDTIWSMNALACSYRRLGRFIEAECLFQQVLQLRQKVLGREHQDTLWTMNRLAWTYSGLEKHEDALALYQETLNLSKSVLGETHPDTLENMYGVALSYGDLGRWEESCEFHEKTLQLRLAALGAEHPDTLESMNSLAGVYRNIGKLEDSVRMYERTVHLRRNSLGSMHPDTIESMELLSLACGKE